MDRDRLAKEISSVFGYQRLGKNLVAVITEGILYAKSIKAITVLSNGNYEAAVTEDTKN